MNVDWYGEPIMTHYIDLPFSANSPTDDDVNDSQLLFVPIVNRGAVSGEGTPMYRVHAIDRHTLEHYISELYLASDKGDWDYKSLVVELIDEIKEVV